LLKLEVNYVPITDDVKIDITHIKLISYTVQFLSSIVVHNENIEVLEEIVEELDLEALKRILFLIYTQRLREYEKQYTLGFPQMYDEYIIPTAFQIFIILTILREAVPSRKEDIMIFEKLTVL